jgi:zinc D-Ala-D-Ala carboxypeptidase
MITDWNKYPNFSKREFDCKHTGRNDMQPEFMEALQSLRTEYGKPLVVSSGYRDVTHPAESGKNQPGIHTEGLAVDITIRGADAYRFLGLAIKHGFTGIGVSQKGASRYIHLDLAPTNSKRYPRPTVWSY